MICLHILPIDTVTVKARAAAPIEESEARFFMCIYIILRNRGNIFFYLLTRIDIYDTILTKVQDLFCALY